MAYENKYNYKKENSYFVIFYIYIYKLYSVTKKRMCYVVVIIIEAVN